MTFIEVFRADPKDALSSRLLAYTDSQIGRVLLKKGDAAAASLTLHKALRIYTDLAAKMSHNYYVSNNFANIFMGLEDAHLALASNNKTAASDRRDQWLEARAWYKKSSDVWLALERQGQLSQRKKMNHNS